MIWIIVPYTLPYFLLVLVQQIHDRLVRFALVVQPIAKYHGAFYVDAKLSQTRLS